MARLIYFLKAAPIPADPLEEPIVPYVFAESVLRLGGKLRADNAQTALPVWRDGRLEMCSRRLPDRTFCGYAYRMPAPSWFVFRPVAKGAPR